MGVGTEVTNAITPPTRGGKARAQLGCAIKSVESCLVGSGRWMAAMELSYFSGGLLGVAEPAAGRERFAFTTTNGPAGSCALLCSVLLAGQ